jgi:hypothetical protein
MKRPPARRLRRIKNSAGAGENEMDAFRIIFTMFVLRLALPVGALLFVGEQLAKRGRTRDFGR